MNKIITIITTCILIVGCSPTMPKATPILVNPETPISTTTLEPTKTATPEPTPTQMPLEGLLFFDMNGSGLRDEASFNYDATRLTDERQPLQADLLAALTAHVAEHPDIKDGDLVTLEEPRLSGYTVCAMSNCVTTDTEGKFQLVEPGVDRFLNITIKDPNSGSPALEMRYVNKWKREVTVPEYTKDIDSTTMGQLMVVPACDADLAAQVCKKDTDTLLVREQHLNDTSIFELGDGATLQPGSPNEIGLMQGFLTLPYPQDLDAAPILFTYTDLDPRIGYLLDWTDNTAPMRFGDQTIWNDVVPGVYDQHQGTDFAIPLGTPLVALGNGQITNSEGGYPNDYARYVRQLVDIAGDSNLYYVTHGHNSVNLVKVGDSVIRGQIVALSGNDAGLTTTSPHLHLSVWDIPRNIWNKYKGSSQLYDFLFGRNNFENNGRSVIYPNGNKVALDYCPYKNYLFIMGNESSFSK